MSEITVVDGFVRDYYKDMGLVNTYQIPEQSKMYSIPNDSGCTITTNVKPKQEQDTSFARIGGDGKLTGFNMNMAQAGAQAYVNGNTTPSNMACLISMSILDAIVRCSYNYTTIEEFREFVKRFEV
jgi:hypothetical protein